MPRVLLIEPDKILAENTAKFLHKRGWHVGWQPSAEGAIAQADKTRPDVVVMDLQLAGHSGIEFLHEFRSYGDWQSLPVIIYSSIHPDELGGEAAIKNSLSVQDYVQKTQNGLFELAQKIEEAVERTP